MSCSSVPSSLMPMEHHGTAGRSVSFQAPPLRLVLERALDDEDERTSPVASADPVGRAVKSLSHCSARSPPMPMTVSWYCRSMTSMTTSAMFTSRRRPDGARSVRPMSVSVRSGAAELRSAVIAGETECGTGGDCRVTVERDDRRRPQRCRGATSNSQCTRRRGSRRRAGLPSVPPSRCRRVYGERLGDASRCPPGSSPTAAASAPKRVTNCRLVMAILFPPSLDSWIRIRQSQTHSRLPARGKKKRHLLSAPLMQRTGWRRRAR